LREAREKVARDASLCDYPHIEKIFDEGRWVHSTREKM
jgi:hypothetical protein